MLARAQDLVAADTPFGGHAIGMAPAQSSAASSPIGTSTS